MTRSFGLEAPSALEAFKTAVEKFKDDDLNRDLARERACKAWHLCDHAFEALGSNPRFSTLRLLQDHVRHNYRELGYLQDICTESKHAKISRCPPQIDEARYQDGDFSPVDFDPHDFDTPRLEVKLLDGQTILFNDVVDRAVEFWSKFFDDIEIK